MRRARVVGSWLVALMFGVFAVGCGKTTGHDLENTLGRSLPESATNVRYERVRDSEISEFVVPYSAYISAEMDEATYLEFADDLGVSARSGGPSDLSKTDFKRGWRPEITEEQQALKEYGPFGGPYSDLAYKATSVHIDGEMFMIVRVVFAGT